MKTAAVLIGDVRSRGRGICPLPSSTRRGIWQLKCPHPWQFAIREKKNANARGLAQGGGAWAQLELTDALNAQNNSVYINLKYHIVEHECFGNIKIRERFSLSTKFPSRSFLLSYRSE